MASLELRPRLATEIVDAAFQLYGQHFVPLVTLSLAIFAPYVVLEFALTGGLTSGEPNIQSIALVLLPLVGWIVGSFSEAAIVVAVSNSYLNGAPDARGSLRLTLRRFGAILMAVLAKWFMIVLGFMIVFFALSIVTITAGALAGAGSGNVNAVLAAVLILIAMAVSVPMAVYLFARYFAVPATVVLEGLGVRAGLRRSVELSRGMKGKVLGALGLPMLIFFVVQMVLVGVAQVIPVPTFLKFLIQQVPAIVVSPILAVIATLLYYDARIRKEGFDIEVMAAELGSIGADARPPQLPVSPG